MSFYARINGFHMDNLFSPQLLGPAVVALITAAGSYFLIIQKTRKELADETRRALEAFREKAEVAEADLRDRQGGYDRKARPSAGQDHHLGSEGMLT